MEHQGTENYFSLKETDFGLKTAGGILSFTECRTPNTEQASSLHKVSHAWENLLGALIYTTSPAPSPGPSGFAQRVPCPPDKVLFTPGLSQGSAPRASRLSLVRDKRKHDDISIGRLLASCQAESSRTVPSRSNLEDDFLEQPAEAETPSHPRQPWVLTPPVSYRMHHA